jgi:uncharacterized RDD family membrane protein YckC
MRFFNKIKLQTPESVELEFSLAGIGNRAYALIIDYIIWAIALIFLLITWGILSYQVIGWQNNEAQLWFYAINILIFFVIYVGYFVYFETIWKGQTPGKRMAKIRVICDNGRPVGLQQTALRALLRPIDDFIFIGAILIMFTPQEKRLGDLVGGTLVIQEETNIVAAKFPLSERAQPLANQLLETSNIVALLPDDFAVIREYLQRRKIMQQDAKLQLSRNLANQIRDIIELDHIPSGVTADLFLEAVYLAYQQKDRGEI